MNTIDRDYEATILIQRVGIWMFQQTDFDFRKLSHFIISTLKNNCMEYEYVRL